MKPTAPGYFDRDVCQPFYHRGGDNGILLLHGFTGTAAHMRKLADALAARGYTVRTINLPGHAQTEEDMGRADWQSWLQAVKQACLEMMGELRVFTVCGLSMGGVLALMAAEQMKVDGCVPISAPMAVKNRFLHLAGPASLFIKRISWGDPGNRASLVDPAYDFGYTGFPTAKGADLSRLIRLARQNLFNLTCPILCVQSDADETIWKGSADCILEGVSSEVRQKLWLSGMPHVCTLSKELPAIVDAVDAFMDRVEAEKEG